MPETALADRTLLDPNFMRQLEQLELLAKRVYVGAMKGERRSALKGDSIEFVKRTLLAGNARIFELMDQATIEALVREHLDGVQNRRLLIWSLLNVEQCLKELE